MVYTVQHNVVYRASTHLDFISRQADQISDRPHLLGPRSGVMGWPSPAICDYVNPTDALYTYVTPFSRISDSDTDAAPRGRLLSSALPWIHTALPPRTTVASLRLLVASTAPRTTSTAASLRLSMEAARHRLALTHNVFLRDGKRHPCLVSKSLLPASWRRVRRRI